MPVARGHHLNGSAPASSLAAQIAAHCEFIEEVTHRPDEVVMPLPRPRQSIAHRIGVRLRREERERERLLAHFDSPPPDARGVD